MNLDAILLIVLFLFLGPLIILSLFFLLPCVRRRQLPAWLVAGVFFPLTQSFPMTKVGETDDEEGKEKKDDLQHQPTDRERQQQQEIQLSLLDKGDSRDGDQLRGEPTPSQDLEPGCCGWRRPPETVTAFRFRERRFRLASTAWWATTVFNFAACTVVAVGCFGFGRIWLLDAEQKSEIIPSTLESWTCSGESGPASKTLPSTAGSCDVASLSAAAATEVKRRNWDEFRTQCPKILAENLFYGCKMASTDQTPSRRKRQSSSDSSATAAVSAASATARLCCSVYADGCWVELPKAVTLDNGKQMTGRCLSPRLCDVCGFSHCNCAKLAADSSAATCSNRRRPSGSGSSCSQDDIDAAVEMEIASRLVADKFADAVTRASCGSERRRRALFETADDEVEAVYRRVVRAANSSTPESRVDVGCVGFCHRWRPNWNDALLGVAVALGLHVGFALVFQFVVVFVVVFFLDASTDDDRRLFRHPRVFPCVRKLALPVFVVLVVALLAALHIVSCGVDSVLITQDIIFAFCFVVVILAGILLPWEDATPLPSCGGSHTCRAVPTNLHFRRQKSRCSCHETPLAVRHRLDARKIPLQQQEREQEQLQMKADELPSLATQEDESLSSVDFKDTTMMDEELDEEMFEGKEDPGNKDGETQEKETESKTEEPSRRPGSRKKERSLKKNQRPALDDDEVEDGPRHALLRRSTKKKLEDAQKDYKDVFGVIEEKPDANRSANPTFSRSSSLIVPLTPEEKKKNPFRVTDAEDDYYKRCFKTCDANDSGHITATELRDALAWINDNPFAERIRRKIDYVAILPIFKQADKDRSLTLEMDEFVDLMKREKIVFAETLFKASDSDGKGRLKQQEVYEALRKAGFVYNGSWSEFLDKFDFNGDDQISYPEFLQALKCLFEDSES